MAFESWGYVEARQHLWPEGLPEVWSPGQIPSAAFRKQIDLEVAKLVAARRPPQMREAAEIPRFVERLACPSAR